MSVIVDLQGEENWAPKVDNVLDNPSYYINRELSWIRFNTRILEEANDHCHPLLE